MIFVLMRRIRWTWGGVVVLDGSVLDSGPYTHMIIMRMTLTTTNSWLKRREKLTLSKLLYIEI